LAARNSRPEGRSYGSGHGGFDVFPGATDVAAHQHFRHFPVTRLDRLQYPTMLAKRLFRTIGGSGELVTIHAHQVIKLPDEHVDQCLVMAALDNPVVKIEIALALEVGNIFLDILL